MPRDMQTAEPGVDYGRAAVLRAARLALEALDPSAPVLRWRDLRSVDHLAAAEASTGRLADRATAQVLPDVRSQLEADRAAVSGAVAAGQPYRPLLAQHEGEWSDMLNDLYTGAGWAAGRKVWSALTGVKLPVAPPKRDQVEPGSPEASYWDEIIAALLLLAGTRATQILTTTADTVDRLVAEGTAEGKPPAEIAREVAQSSAFTPDRAMTISENEADHAVNGGANAGATAASTQSGRPVRKVWQTREDERVRAWHRDANQQMRGVDEPFRVGPDNMQFPKDVTLGAGPANTINCRCRAVYVLR
jgi:Phage Mu protein F like protein